MPLTPFVPFTRPLTLGGRFAASLVTGFAVALATHLATVFVFFATNGASAANLVPISAYFMPATLALFIFASLAAALGGVRNRWTALAVGFAVAMLAAYAGTAYGNLAAGAAWSATVALGVLATLIGTNLVFVVAATVFGARLGRRVFARVASFRPSRPIVLVRRPAANLDSGELTHLERTQIDTDLADQQWAAYVETLAVHGFDTVEVEVADHLPDSVFIEDAVVVFGGIAVVTRPGVDSRSAEIHAARETARGVGLKIREIEAPATLDGGDVLTVDRTVYVGRGGRTNADGIAQLRDILVPLGYTVVAVPVTKALHLKSVVTALPDGTVIGFPKLVDNPAIFDRFLPMPEAGAAVVVLDHATVLMAASVPKSIALVESLGYTVITVDVSEFEKLEGCVTCLSVRIR